MVDESGLDITPDEKDTFETLSIGQIGVFRGEQFVVQECLDTDDCSKCILYHYNCTQACHSPIYIFRRVSDVIGDD